MVDGLFLCRFALDVSVCYIAHIKASFFVWGLLMSDDILADDWLYGAYADVVRDKGTMWQYVHDVRESLEFSDVNPILSVRHTFRSRGEIDGFSGIAWIYSEICRGRHAEVIRWCCAIHANRRVWHKAIDALRHVPQSTFVGADLVVAESRMSIEELKAIKSVRPVLDGYVDLCSVYDSGDGNLTLRGHEHIPYVKIRDCVNRAVERAKSMS
jgi:hypothetical protein